jgi:hypothetical protein
MTAMANRARPWPVTVQFGQMYLRRGMVNNRIRRCARTMGDGVTADLRRGPLGDSQIFEWWKRQGPEPGMTVRASVRLTEVAEPAVCRAAIHELVRRHEALRTTVHLGPGGHPEQVVRPFSPDLISIKEVPDRTSRDEFNARIWLDKGDIERDAPCQACLFVTDGGAVTEVVVIVSHTVADGASGAVIDQELRELIRTGDRCVSDVLPPVRRQLLDVVAHDSSAATAAERAAAEHYWREQYRRAPSRVFLSAHHTRYRLYSGHLRSQTAPGAIAVVARRFRATPAVVYSAAVCMVLAARSRQPQIVFRTHYDARVPDVARTVGCLSRVLFVTVDMADTPSLAEVIRRLRRSMLAAQRNYRIAWTRLKELEALESARRGASFAYGTTVNFGSSPDYQAAHLDRRTYPDTLPAKMEAEHALSRAFVVDDEWAMDAYLRIIVGRRSMTVEAGFNGAVLDTSDMDALLCVPEPILRRAVSQGDVTLAEVLSAVGTRTTTDREAVPAGCRTSLDQIEAVLSRHPNVLAARCDMEAASGALVAFTATESRGLRPEDLRSFVLGAVSPTSSLRCPDRFVTCAAPADGRYDEDVWHRLIRLADGSGRQERPATHGSDDRLAALLDAVEMANQIRVDDTGKSYVQAGGSLILVPAILRRLAGMGLTGLHPNDFRRIAPLWLLAGELNGPGAR